MMIFDRRNYHGPMPKLHKKVEPPRANPNSSFLKDGNVDGVRFNARLATLFNHWVNSSRWRRESPLGRLMERELGFSRTSRSGIAIIVDSVPYLKKSLEAVDLNAASGQEYVGTLLQFAYGCGAEACAAWLAQAFKDEINEEDKISLISASGNFDWLMRFLLEKGYSQLPGLVYEHASRDDVDELAQSVGINPAPSLLK